MVVQHNLTAMNSNRMLGITTRTQAKSTEKLSSGYKINRAADDAAGLSISEKMRKQIRGLTQASLNAQDGISAVQTAEGALNEVQDMLQRMNELAVKAANGTMSEDDRSYIQNEISQLETEIDRVAETTKFNETYLLKGSDATKTKTIDAHDAGLAGKLTDNGNGTSTFALEKALENGDNITIAGKEYTIGQAKTTANYTKLTDIADIVLEVGDSVTVGSTTKTLTDDLSMARFNGATLANGDKLTTANGTVYTHNGTKWLNDDGTDAKVADINVAKSTEGTIYTTAAGKDHTLVATLKAGEVSSFELTDTKASTVAADTNDGNTSITLAKGSSVTVSGKTITATDDNFVASAFSVIKNGIMGSAAGKTVTIADIEGNAIGTYTIVENSDDEDATNLTRESIIDKIKEGYQVTYTDKAGTSTKATAAGVDPVSENTISVAEAYKKIADELTAASSIGADKDAKVVNKGDGTFDITQGTVEVKADLTFNLHVGADADMTNKISVDFEAMSAANLGIKGINVADDSGTSATYAVDAILDAIQKVSTQRSALGAVQNRLDHTINNLDNVVENTTSAESQIRDTDMATEMVKYSNNQILAQAGQAMLAQSNQSNQGVLSLLQ